MELVVLLTVVDASECDLTKREKDEMNEEMMDKNYWRNRRLYEKNEFFEGMKKSYQHWTCMQCCGDRFQVGKRIKIVRESWVAL